MKSFIAMWFVPVTHLENDRLCLPKKRCLWSVPVNSGKSLELVRHTDCGFDTFRWRGYDIEDQSRAIRDTTASILVFCFILARMGEGWLRLSENLCTRIKHSGEKTGQRIHAMETLITFRTKSFPYINTGVCCMLTVDWKIGECNRPPIPVTLCFLFDFFLFTSWDTPLRPSMTPFSYTTFKKDTCYPQLCRGITIENCVCLSGWQINDLMHFILWISLLSWPC